MRKSKGMRRMAKGGTKMMKARGGRMAKGGTKMMKARVGQMADRPINTGNMGRGSRARPMEAMKGKMASKGGTKMMGAMKGKMASKGYAKGGVKMMKASVGNLADIRKMAAKKGYKLVKK